MNVYHWKKQAKSENEPKRIIEQAKTHTEYSADGGGGGVGGGGRSLTLLVFLMFCEPCLLVIIFVENTI
jgi:hypothetical protein